MTEAPPRDRRGRLGLGLAVVVGLAGAVVLAWPPDDYQAELAAPFDAPPTDWAGSTTCASCHPDHHASWHRTFHRTMTQEATPDTVLGAFDGRIVDYWGVEARPLEEDGRYFVEYVDDDGRAFNRLEVRRTVGSRRYQQYLVQSDEDDSGNYYRIPLLWHIEEARWIHLNGAFLGHDDAPYDQHLAVWNQNCVFCHNTGPEPGSTNYDDLVARSGRGERVSPEFDGRYETDVAELGISCESCHGPAGEHARRNRDPVRRYLLHLGDEDDPTVVDPAALDAARSVDVCGQCHGQRLPRPRTEIRTWLHEGPRYRAGDRLQDTVEPVFRETPSPGAPDLFRLRFWNDGTPRLTAYEYQGLLQSPCFTEGDLTCIDCHTMHGGDVFGQLPPENRKAAACASCHGEIVRDAARHSGHPAGSSGTDCYACHMPRMIYGVLDIHRTHRIHEPDPGPQAEAARPDACTSCHLDRSVTWAAERSAEIWGDAYQPPEQRGDGAPTGLVATTASLFAGDPVQRAVAARLAGRDDAPGTALERAFLVPLLLRALGDDYPAVRWLARKSLRALLAELARDGFAPDDLADAVEAFDPIAAPDAREAARRRLVDLWGRRSDSIWPLPPEGSLVTADLDLDEEAIAALVRLQASKVVHIGE